MFIIDKSIFQPHWFLNCGGKIRILPLEVQECPDFSILQTIYPYIARMAGFASKIEGMAFSWFLSLPRIFAARQLHAPGFWGISA